MSLWRRVERVVLLTAILGALAGDHAMAQLACNAAPEGFANGVPAGWTVADAAGGGVVWGNLSACRETVNFTGGSGGAVCVSSDRSGPAEVDTTLVSPVFSLAGATTSASLVFRANYQNFSRFDFLDLDLSTNGGSTWTTLQRWNEDHGLFRQPDGEEVAVDLSAYKGMSNLRLRWRVYDPGTGDFDWYGQLDEVRIQCDQSPCPGGGTPLSLSDPSFEAGPGGTAWLTSSTSFASPICTRDSCGFAGARSGNGWAFLGGKRDLPESTSLEQSVLLPLGIAKLRFYVWIAAASDNGQDFLRVLVDGQELFRVGEGNARFRDTYARVEVDVSEFADGGSHVLRFEAETTGTAAHTSFFIDDVSLAVCTAVVENPDITISDVTLTEGNLGTQEAAFTVRLSGAARRQVTVDFATADVTASAGSDYQARSGRLTFAPGVTSQVFTVPVLSDTTDEGDEAFNVALSNPVNAKILDGTGVGTIRNDDTTWLTINDSAALEKDDSTTIAVFTVTLSNPSSRTVLVDYRTVDGTATAGRDYVSVTSTLSFPPGTTSRTLTVQVTDDRTVERDESFVVRLNNPTNAAIERDQGNGSIIDNDRGRYPVEGTDVVYTIDNDFDQGRLLNLTYEAVPNQLQLSRTLGTYPFIWVAASDRGTVVKVDTRTGTILGEYSTNPDAGSAGFPNPSRTTVGLDGSVWAGNRGDGSVIHVGLPETGQCVDRNGNGKIDTSTGYGDILAWPNAGGADSAGGVSTAQDECILHYVKVSASVVRHLSIDRNSNLWVSGLGGSNDRVFNLIDGRTGAILRTEGPLACGGYGGLVDRNGVLWSATYNGSVLRWDPAVVPPTSSSLRCITGVASYGLAIDAQGNVWVAGPADDRVWKISSNGATVSGPYRHGSPAAQGLAVDSRGDVWVSSAKWGNSATVGHLKSNGTFLGNVTGVPPGSSGVAVDGNGKIWTANAAASSLSRIDPSLGPLGADGQTPVGQVDLTVALPGANPYNYSDMTGSLALASTSPQGTWMVTQDGGAAGTVWGTILWNTEPAGGLPAGSSILVEARAAETEAGLGGLPFLAVTNGVPFELVGRFLQVRVTIRPNALGASPVLSDLRIRTAPPPAGTVRVSVSNVTAFEGNVGTADTVFEVKLSQAAGAAVTVAYATEDGGAYAGSDFTAKSGTLTFPAGTTKLTVAVPVTGDIQPEDEEQFFLRLKNPTGAQLGDAMGVATIVDNDGLNEPVEGVNRLYSLDADFDLGKLFNANHDSPGNDQLQVSNERTTFPYLWVAASARGTVVKIDTRTGAILGEYSTNPDTGSASVPDPSRTTVSLDGSIWAGNRGDGSVIHVGLVEEGQCVDRNGNGIIETSTGYGNVLAWPNPSGINSNGGVSKALDECILHYVKVSTSIVRHVTVDRDNNLWVSGRYGTNNAVFNYINGQTGQILRTEGPFPCGGYGGLIDKNGILWSSNQQGPVLRWDPSVQPVTPSSYKCVEKFFDWRYSYGLAADSQGNIWVTGVDGNNVWKIPPDGSTVLGPFQHGSVFAQGLAVDSRDHIWVSSALNCCYSTVGHLLPNGTFLGNVAGVPFGSTGVAIDSQGKIWTANIIASNVSRIDPNAGPIGSDGVTRVGAVDLVVGLPGTPGLPAASPYNYSDMTGSIALQKTLPRGTWEVIQDGGLAGTVWGKITWNTEAEGSLPPGTVILVEVRAADTLAGLGGQSFVPVQNGAGFTVTGRYLDVRVVLRPDANGVSPILSDIRIQTGDYLKPRVAITGASVVEGDAGQTALTFTAALSAPATQEVRVDYFTSDGDAVSPADYEGRRGTIVIPAGQTAQTVSFPVIGDVIDEYDETFLLTLDRPFNASLGDAQAAGTILDDDEPAVLSVTDVTVEEGDEGTVEAVFEISLSKVPGQTVTVDYTTIDGTASADQDYRPAVGYLTFPPGTTSLTVKVEVVGDTATEQDETFTVHLSNPAGAIFGKALGLGTIIDDDNVEVFIQDVEVVEGDSGTTAAVFTLTSPSPPRQPVNLDYTTVAGSATEGKDYVAASGTLTWPAGQASAMLTVQVKGDLFLEEDETFSVRLSNPVNAVVLDNTGEGTIRDDEACPGPNLISNAGAELRSAGGEIAGWTEIQGTDWSRWADVPAVEGRWSFAAGTAGQAELVQDVSVSAFADFISQDLQKFAFEGWLRTGQETVSDSARIVLEYRDETNTVVLDTWDTGAITSPGTWQRVQDVRTAPHGTGWIRIHLLGTRRSGTTNDALFDALTLRALRSGALTINDVQGYETAGSLTTVTFQVRLSCPLEEPLTVQYATADGTALSGQDYLSTAGTLTFPAGSTAQPIPMQIVGDEVDEPHEHFFMNLASPSTEAAVEVVLLDPQGRGLILNDDACRRGPGYWKTHPEVWPVDYLVLGGVEYEKQTLLNFLSYNGPDAATRLAHHLTATKLNLAVGSDPSILPTVQNADAFLAAHPPGSDPKGSLRTEANSIKDILDVYNNSGCD
jgi:streptogramin lyase